MQIILTHEQADFDAIASLLAAHLLDEGALPVLPRRLNRNVSAFLTLYGNDLPFLDARDIPAGSIDRVTLVDTQSLVTLKGMSSDIAVSVVDHHKIKSSLPEAWEIMVERIGSTTTILVEKLMKQNGDIPALAATLMLLGIYEDTGSLTYLSTTPRDLRASAYLLEQGANIKIAGDYLNPPLSSEQIQLYDRLLASAETTVINGQKIITSQAAAEGMTDEISSIAHKLRDLLDPDALILLVRTDEGIRLVARSSSSRINVAAVAAHFGGGGHNRASAALIKPASREQQPCELESLTCVYNELLQILPDYILPPVTVGSIMSREPRLLLPDTQVQQALELMQRYGYEGYPVVDGNQVIGLLTRRAVDRAINHKLNLTARSLMDAGEVVVHPTDTVEMLQRVMTTSGWGQVPVVDPSTRQVLGIVTRTDLIKTLVDQDAHVLGRRNLAEKLEQALPSTRLALLKLVAACACQEGMAAYIVGGFVRDLLLERPSLDFDVVVEGNAIHLADRLQSDHGGRVLSHKRFGTAKWWIADADLTLGDSIPGDGGARIEDLPESLDIISARTEFYNYPSALPTVERGSIKLDLHRRDFTINTMAMRLDGRHYGELYDYWGGVSDLRRGEVRVLHSLSFVDDPTRMLRAVRFEQRFNFKIEARTLQLMDEARSLLPNVSGDRLRHELNLILLESSAAAMLRRLDELDLLRHIHPSLTCTADRAAEIHKALAGALPCQFTISNRQTGGLTARQAMGYLIWLLDLPSSTLGKISQRLRFSRDFRQVLESAANLWRDLPAMTDLPPSQIVARLDSVPELSLWAVCQRSPAPEMTALLEKYESTWKHIKPSVTGRHLIKLGISPGPVFREILNHLRSAWLDGLVTSKTEEAHLLDELLNAHGMNGSAA